MKALVTGASGFIGSHVAELLLRRGHEVLGVSQQAWPEDTPQELVESVELLSWDIQFPADESLVRRLVTFAPDVLFHFAGLSIPSQCGHKTPTERALAVNVVGTQNVLTMQTQLPTTPRLVFASTCHVYQRVDRRRPTVTEASPLVPSSAYGETKLRGEQIIRDQYVKSKACIVRGFHHIGPRQPSGLMLTDWLGQIAPGCDQLAVRSTHSFLDLIDVRDAARAYYLLATTPDCIPTCNLGSGQVARSGEVLDAVLRFVGHPLQVTVESEREFWNPIADISILSSLGWRPEIPYNQTISDMMSCRTAT